MNHPQRVLAAALFAVSAAAVAQQDAPPPAKDPTANPTVNDPPRDATTPRTPATAPLPMKSFEEYDTNGDGTISQAEFSPASAKGMTLAQVDRNHDGRVSREEWNAHKQGKDDTQRK